MNLRCAACCLCSLLFSCVACARCCFCLLFVLSDVVVVCLLSSLVAAVVRRPGYCVLCVLSWLCVVVVLMLFLFVDVVVHCWCRV